VINVVEAVALTSSASIALAAQLQLEYKDHFLYKMMAVRNSN
jgi:hypothetical protein